MTTKKYWLGYRRLVYGLRGMGYHTCKYSFSVSMRCDHITKTQQLLSSCIAHFSQVYQQDLKDGVMHVPTRDHLWTNHEVRLEKDLQVVPGRHMQCLILQILVEREWKTIKKWAIQLICSQLVFAVQGVLVLFKIVNIRPKSRKNKKLESERSSEVHKMLGILK